MSTFTRLPLAVGEWQSNFIALPQEFAKSVRSSPDFASSQGVVCFRLNWTALSEEEGEGGNGKPVTKECFVGWSGLISRGQFLQCPKALAEQTGLYSPHSDHGVLLNVYAVRACEIATRVDLDPETVEDWETLEKHAGFVEEQLLGQIGVVFPHQTFTVWVANLPVKLRVLECGNKPVRLGNNTELVVTPKPRPSPPPAPQAVGGGAPAKYMSASKGKPVKLRVQVLESALDGVGYVNRSTVELLRERAGWSVAENEHVSDSSVPRVGELVNPETRVFVQLGSGAEDGPLLTLEVDDRVALMHIGLSLASMRLDCSQFERVTLRPISQLDHLQPYAPTELVLRRLVFPDSAPVLLDPGAVLRHLGELDSSVSIQHDGCWLSVGSELFKLVAPVTNRFWFSREKPDKFTFGDDVVIDHPLAGQRYQHERQVTLPNAATNVLQGIKSHFAPLLSRSQSKLLRTQKLGTPFSGGVYLYAPRGFGKRTLLRQLERAMNQDDDFLTHFVFVDCTLLRGGKRGQVTEAFDKALCLAKERSPSVLVLEELDSLLPQPANPAEEEDASTVWLCEYLESMIVQHKALSFQTVGFMATGRGKRSLKVELLKLGSCFECGFELVALDRDARACVLASLGNQDQDLEQVAGKTEGFTCADLETLSVRSAMCGHGSLIQGLEGFVPANLRGVKLAKSDTLWSDVGGLADVRDVLKDTLELPFQFAELYKSSPLRLASGILLYGASGTGKTLLAGAVASECGLNFISVKGPEILNKYIGASEQAIRDLFARAASVAPCIIFFDEFDAIAPRRGNDSTGVTDRVVNQMLTFLDGVESREGVYVMAATSRPDLVDPALLRPGRLDKQLYCSFPTASERLSILQAVCSKVVLGEGAQAKLEEIAFQGTELTGADLQALIATAQLLTAHDNVVAITPGHLQRAYLDTRPSVSRDDRVKLERLYAKFRGDRDTSFEDTASGKQKVALM
ncbi:hypothetical protein BASA81_003270 [Batrachochytrium salamandrivorans]|nr:hypothetical protein BASA81_003270 [Batrachochytrium salamandrivorans]